MRGKLRVAGLCCEARRDIIIFIISLFALSIYGYATDNMSLPALPEKTNVSTYDGFIIIKIKIYFDTTTIYAQFTSI